LKVGKDRIVFVKPRLDETKEAITKQDIRDLKNEGAIIVKPIKGRTKNTKRKVRKSVGNVRKKVDTRKKDYVIMTRKLRKYVAEMKKQGKLSREEVKDIRNKIRNKGFKSKANLRDYIGGLRK
jgi:ribosomal protein L19E